MNHLETISTTLRANIHDLNNIFFVIKGYLEELKDSVQSEDTSKNPFNDYISMLSVTEEHIQKATELITTMQKFVKEDIFTIPSS